MFLTPEELETLSERKRKADQESWLKKHRIPYLPGANGHPRVSRAFVESVLAGKREAGDPEPNFAALDSLRPCHGTQPNNS